MPSNLIDRSRQTANTRVYWQFRRPVGGYAQYFRQILYLALTNAVQDLDKALSEVWLDCGQDLHKLLCEFVGAVKVRITVQVAYEPVKPMAKQAIQKILERRNDLDLLKRQKKSLLPEIHISKISETLLTGSKNLTQNSSGISQVSDSLVYCD